jgi:hypothetical protein
MVADVTRLARGVARLKHTGRAVLPPARPPHRSVHWMERRDGLTVSGARWTASAARQDVVEVVRFDRERHRSASVVRSTCSRHIDTRSLIARLRNWVRGQRAPVIDWTRWEDGIRLMLERRRIRSAPSRAPFSRRNLPVDGYHRRSAKRPASFGPLHARAGRNRGGDIVANIRYHVTHTTAPAVDFWFASTAARAFSCLARRWMRRRIGWSFGQGDRRCD